MVETQFKNEACVEKQTEALGFDDNWSRWTLLMELPEGWPQSFPTTAGWVLPFPLRQPEF